ncbi:MAG: Glutamate/gamma-aminobutyrate antiporter [Legionellaceae bacterium]
MLQNSKITHLSLFALVMLITGAIDSIRNLPATALFGHSLIFFFIFSAIVFLIPTALVSAELSSTWPEKSGIYQWVKLAFGKNVAFLAIWLQWINTIVWYPTILSFIAGTAAYLINPALAENKLYLVSVIISTFWLLTLINLKGIHTSAKFASFCAVIGMLIPMGLIIFLAIIWVIMGKPLQITLNANSLIPSLHDSANWLSLTAIMTSFLGVELATVHVNKIHNAQKNFPKAIFISTLFILFTMILGSLAIAIVLPQQKISLVNGVMQAFTNFFAVYHLSAITPLMTLLLLIGSLGGIINWIISPAKGLLQAAHDGFLPAFLKKENQHGIEQHLLIVQAIFVTLLCAAFLLMPSVNGSYWLLTALSTQLYMLMYVIMFLAAIRLKYKYPLQPRPFSIPGKKLGIWLISLLGLIGCSITLIVGFIPPNGINVGSFQHYVTIFTLGMLGMILPIIGFYIYKKVSTTA